MMNLIIAVAALLLGFADFKTVDKRSAVCYDGLGCFSTDPPFTSSERPVAVTPETPDKMQTKFELYTRESRTSMEVLDARHPETHATHWTHFKKRPTKFLIHGFLDTPILTPMWHDLKNELLTNGDYNVIIVDWSLGNEFPYDQACANARVVGVQISNIVKQLIADVGIAAKDVHIIGHSLGAHICGYAGEKIPGLGRITGLDPAGPYFENTDKIVRLDEGDAEYVDIIHTDATNLLLLGLGTKTQSGHADFYPNLGHDQPGCTRDPITNIFLEGLISGVEDTVACSHIRAVKYFSESVNTKCPFLGFPCASEADFKNNLCHSCTSGGCSPLGLHSDTHIPPKGQHVKYYLTTAGHAPFCENHLSVSLKLASGKGFEEKGVLDMVINGEKGTSDNIELTGDSNPTTLNPGHTYNFNVLVPSDVGAIKSVTFTWNQKVSIFDPDYWNIFRDPKLYIDEIDISRDEAGAEVHLCASGQSVSKGDSLTIFTSCSN